MRIGEIQVDWRVALGGAVTVTWIFFGLVYLLGIVGWSNFVNLPTADIGSFLEGAFAPLAFLWLVIGHFMQQKEIVANTKAISIQEMSARRLEVHSQRDSYFKFQTLIQVQLGSISSFHYISIVGATGTNEVSAEEFAAMRTESDSSDPALFVRKMVSMTFGVMDDADALREIFYGTDVRKRHSSNYQTSFSKLLELADSVDMDSVIRNALLYSSPYGILYRIMRHASGEEVFDPQFGLVSQPLPVESS